MLWPRLRGDALKSKPGRQESLECYDTRSAVAHVERLCVVQHAVDECGRIWSILGATRRISSGCDWSSTCRRDVTLHGPSDKLTQTDSEGQFDFQSLPDGQYELTATLPGFAPARKIARLIAAERSAVSLTLTVLILEQTVVTAARTGEADVQTVPMAVSVLPEATGSDAGSHGRGHRRRAPGVTFAQNTGRAQITIRGIGTNAVAPGSDPSSALYLDGVYLARPAMVLADFLDRPRRSTPRTSGDPLWSYSSAAPWIRSRELPTSDKELRFGCGRHDAPFAPTRA